MKGAPDPEIVEEPSRHRFVLAAQEQAAELVYREDGGRLVLVHTAVPAALRRRGIGGRLFRAALARARRTGECVAPVCPFAR